MLLLWAMRAVHERKGCQMYRLENKPLDFTPHQNEEYNHIKKQYVKHLLTMVEGAEDPIFSPGGIVANKLLEILMTKISYAHPSETMFLFDIIETLKDPEYFLTDCRDSCDENTRIFITCPCRTIMSFWSYNHWHEIDPLRFKHLVEGCGFKIVQHKDKIILKTI